MGDAETLGFGHFLRQSDYLARVLLFVLATMSIASWYLILYKGLSQLLLRRRSQKYLQLLRQRNAMTA